MVRRHIAISSDVAMSKGTGAPLPSDFFNLVRNPKGWNLKVESFWPVSLSGGTRRLALIVMEPGRTKSLLRVYHTPF